MSDDTDSGPEYLAVSDDNEQEDEQLMAALDGHSSDGDDNEDGNDSWEDIEIQEENIWTGTARKFIVKCDLQYFYSSLNTRKYKH